MIEIEWQHEQSIDIYSFAQKFPLLGHVVGDLYFDDGWCLEIENEENCAIDFIEIYEIPSVEEGKMIAKEKLEDAIIERIDFYTREIAVAKKILQK
jgi:hypothetical protein